MPLIRVQSNHDKSAATNPSSSVSLINSLPSSLCTVDIGIDLDETSLMEENVAISTSDSLLENHAVEDMAISTSDSLETFTVKDLIERQRREKIGLANRGRMPWNKGKQHSAETRERIKQKTREALKNLKVREKMADRPRSHSDQVKSKIGSSLKRVWAKRLKWKRSRAKFFNSWAVKIVEAAKTGGPGQEVLHWDSYDKIKQELTQRQLDLVMEKQKAKELARIKREERVVLKKQKAKLARIKREERVVLKKQKAEKLARVKREKRQMSKEAMPFEKPVRKRKSREERRKEKEEMAKAKRKLKQETRDSKKRLKLKERLSQIRQKVSNSSQVRCPKDRVTYHSPAWENFDMELIQRESSQREVSLADQIRAAKNKKAELATLEPLASSFSVSSLRPKP